MKPLTLSARISAASVEQTREMLEEAFKYIHPPTPGSAGWIHDIPRRAKWFRLMYADAYHDAVMMLIQPGWMITYLSELGLAGGCVCELGNPGTSGEAKSDEGARTLILAIAAAAVKCKESE